MSHPGQTPLLFCLCALCFTLIPLPIRQKNLSSPHLFFGLRQCRLQSLQDLQGTQKVGFGEGFVILVCTQHLGNVILLSQYLFGQSTGSDWHTSPAATPIVTFILQPTTHSLFGLYIFMASTLHLRPQSLDSILNVVQSIIQLLITARIQIGGMGSFFNTVASFFILINQIKTGESVCLCCLAFGLFFQEGSFEFSIKIIETEEKCVTVGHSKGLAIHFNKNQIRLQSIQMIQLLRKVVAGAKRKTIWKGKELDLTYITDRIIAMAYPAWELLQKTYRNSMEDVAEFLTAYHGENYLVINVSSRPYNHGYFSGRVKDYAWPDHQAPPLTTLVQVAHDIKRFMDKHPKGVVAVHCNHGKGRTGTAIIAFILYVSIFNSVPDALVFYNTRRFSPNEIMKVDQPCQIRYLDYINQLKQLYHFPTRLPAYRFVAGGHRGLSPNHFIEISRTRTGEVKLEKALLNCVPVKTDNILIGDILIKIYEDKWLKNNKIARINCNLFFLAKEEGIKNKLVLKFKSDQIKLQHKNQSPFEICLEFEYFCLCHLEGGVGCACEKERIQEESAWLKMISHFKETKQLKPSTSYTYLLLNITTENDLRLRQQNELNAIVEREADWNKFIDEKYKRQGKVITPMSALLPFNSPSAT